MPILPRTVALDGIRDVERFVLDVIVAERRRAGYHRPDDPDFEDDFATLLLELYVAHGEYDPGRSDAAAAFSEYAAVVLRFRYHDLLRARLGRHPRSNGRLRAESLERLLDTGAGNDQLAAALGRRALDVAEHRAPDMSRVLRGRGRAPARPVPGVRVGANERAA